MFKELVFIAQGNPYAPVTNSAIIKQTSKDVDKAGTLENICFWTPDQLSVADAEEMEFVFLNSFYSTGKTTLLKHRVKYLHEKLKKSNENVGRVFYFINKMENVKNKLPFTLMTEYEFQKQKLNVIVRETNFIPGKVGYSVEDWMSKSRSKAPSMAIPVVEFSREGYEIRKIFG